MDFLPGTKDAQAGVLLPGPMNELTDAVIHSGKEGPWLRCESPDFVPPSLHRTVENCPVPSHIVPEYPVNGGVP